MKSETSTRYSIIPAGGLKEEVWERSDIESMCRAGRLSRDSLVYIPEDGSWKKIIDTDLAGCLAQGEPSGKEPADPSRNKSKYEGEYESLVQQIRTSPGDTSLRLSAASLALAMGETNAARTHYQEALDLSPYHPRIAQEAKRNLPASKWKSLRYLEKPPQVWDDPAAIFRYPLSRGPLYFAVAAAVLTGLFWTLWTIVPAFLVLSLWMSETIRSSSRGEPRPPLWDGLAVDPLRRIGRPLAVSAVVAAAFAGVFAFVAGIFVLARLTSETNVLRVVAKSPVLSVVFCTLGLAVFPLVIMLAGSSTIKIAHIVSPKRIVSTIRALEVEYVGSAFFLAIFCYAVWGVGLLVDSIPLLPHAYYGAAAAYTVLAGGFVFGRLYARFAEGLDERTPESESDAE